MNDVTRVLSQIQSGDPTASERLLPLVYDELRKLAAFKLAHERPGQILQATALVHDAYIRLIDVAEPKEWNGRGHFFAAAAEAMRRILVEDARRRNSLKRGGGVTHESLHNGSIVTEHPIEELLAVDDVLDQLAAIDASAADLVKLRFFVGLNTSEVAAALGVSIRTAHDIWAYARTWLHQRLSEGHH